MSSAICTVCGGGHVRELLEIADAPVFVNQLCHSEAEATSSPRAPLRLGFCEDCGHLFNTVFDPKLLEYSPEYENSLHFSARFQSYADALAGKLVDQYALHGKTVVEVGCGNGDFLRAVCRIGGCRGFGFDPSYRGEAAGSADSDVRIERAAYGAEHAVIATDLLCCRHCLEHIAEPVAFLHHLAEVLQTASTGQVFFEVPNGLFTLQSGGIWDLIYEHCGYFTPSSLAHAFARAGFAISELTTAFDGQFLTAHGKLGPATAGPRVDADLRASAERFARAYGDKVAEFDSKLAQATRQGRRVVVWGAGSKGNSFLNRLDPGRAIECVVDINPRKHGKFVVGTGHPIVAPSDLVPKRPDLVVVMNPIYTDEIAQTLASLGINGVEMWCA